MDSQWVGERNSQGLWIFVKMEEEVQGEEPEGRVRVESSEGKGAG